MYTTPQLTTRSAIPPSWDQYGLPSLDPGVTKASSSADRAQGASFYQTTTLENGIRVSTELMPEARSISLGIVVDAGPADEGAEQSGLAHLTEHLLFQGTKGRNAQQIGQLMDLAGGPLGGFTARDYTCYHATVLDEDHTYALELLGDCFLNSVFPVESVDREKQAILREIAAGRDTPGERVHNLLKARAWEGHPLGRPITGLPQTVQALTRDDVLDFLRHHYLPDRVVVAAAGRIEHEQFVAQVRDSFWPLTGASRRQRPDRPRHIPGAVIDVAPLVQSYFAIGLPAPAYTAADRYAWHVLNVLLGGGTSSRLVRSLREERGWVYDVSSEYHAYRDAGMLVIEGSTAPELLLPVLGTVLMRVSGLASGLEPPDEEEVWRARTQVRRQHLLAGESTATRMNRLATQELYFGAPISSAAILARIAEVERGALEQVCARWLATGLRDATCAVVGPEAPSHDSAAVLEDMLAGFR